MTEEKFREILEDYGAACREAGRANNDPFCDPGEANDALDYAIDKLEEAVTEIFRARSSEG